MWGVVPIVLDWLTFYGAVIEGDYTRRRAGGAGVDHDQLSAIGHEQLHGAENVVCITGGPSTTTIDQLSDHCFILTWFLAYIVYARYKWLRRAHLTGRRPRSVWTGDHDHGDREVSAVMMWDGLTTILFTLLTSCILTYIVGDHSFSWFRSGELRGFFRQIVHVAVIVPGEEEQVRVRARATPNPDPSHASTCHASYALAISSHLPRASERQSKQISPAFSATSATSA